MACPVLLTLSAHPMTLASQVETGTLQLLLFDQRDMASITVPAFRRVPGGLLQPRSRR
jgi:hypothetical protein